MNLVQPFSREHAETMVVVVGVIAGVVGYGRSLSIERAHNASRVFAVVLMLFYVVENAIRVGLLGAPVSVIFPFELCSILFFVAAAGFWTNKRWLLDIVVFWTFSGTFQAMITPTPWGEFLSLEYVRYFAAHSILVLAATWAVIAHGHRPTPMGAVRAFILLQIWAAIGGTVNALSGQNYMFLRHPPRSPTLFDYLGRWPWYILSLELVGIISFAIWLGLWALVLKTPLARPEKRSEA
ncbi:MAG: TIGR02206 family membrane protein [Deltaproteobacteria bacterium]|nr:TIGR02206 family membrane protein [Deltaproteobacteria bacterium]